MPTIIQRRTTNAPSTARRSPFPTPGPQPAVHVSALNVQSGQGVSLPSVESVGTSPALLTATAGGAPIMNLFNGIPGLQFGSATAGLTTPAGVGIWLSFVGVLRVGDLHTAGNAQISRGASSMGLSLATDGQLGIYGGGSTGRSTAVKVSSYPARPQFIAGVFNGAASLVQVDGARATVSTGTPATAGPLIIGDSTGVTGPFQFQLTELEAHTTVLTAAQLDEKYRHYRSLYQL